MDSTVAALNGRIIHTSGRVPAPRGAVWETIATRDGALTYFAPEASIDPVPGGPYEIYFHVFSPLGLRGSEGCRVMVVDPPSHLRHTWNAPPSLPEVRHHQTVVDWYLSEDGPDATRVDLYHYGWEIGGQWDDAFAYFSDAWQTVLDRLAARFNEGPMDWEPLLARWRSELTTELAGAEGFEPSIS